MKKYPYLIIIFILINIFISSCTSEEERKINHLKYPEIIRVEYIYEVPDSLSSQMATFIENTVKAATNNLKTDDYEDTDDLVEQTQESAFEIYKRKVIQITFHDEDGYSYSKPIDLLTKTEMDRYNAYMKK